MNEMREQNDPVRLRRARTRLLAALLAAVLLLAIPGFSIIRILAGPAEFESLDEVAPGDYVQDEVYLLMGYCAAGYRGETVTEQYAVVPVNGKLAVFCFPSRWLDSADEIYSSTQSLLSGSSSSIDKYLRVTGTVKTMPEDVSAQLYSWFSDNQDWLEQLGLVSDSSDAADYLADVVVYVDEAGGLPVTAVEVMFLCAVACLIYAVIVLVRILRRRYAAPDIVVEISEDGDSDPAPEVLTEPAEDVSADDGSDPAPEVPTAPAEACAESGADAPAPEAPAESADTPTEDGDGDL